MTRFEETIIGHTWSRIFTILPRIAVIAHARVLKFKPQRQLERFPPAGPMESVAIDIVSALTRIKTGNQFILFVTARHSTL